MIAQLFKVATEFRFEIGSAVLASKNLQGQVEGITKSVEGAEIAFKKMALQGALSIGLGTTSVVGSLKQAIAASERFKQSQLQFSTIFSANKENLIGPVDDFNARMNVSEQILKRIAQLSQEFSLDEGAFADSTKLLGAALIPKGLAGKNMENAIDLSKDFLKSAPLLGIDPNLAQNQLLNIIGGAAGQQNTLFRRLTAETQAFRPFQAGEGGSKSFNQLNEIERFELLQQGLAQFASSQEELTAQTMTLGRSMVVLRNAFSGFNGILKSLGDVAVPVSVKQIQAFTGVVNNEFRRVLAAVSEVTKIVTSDMTNLMVTLTQLSRVSKDFQSAAKSLGVIGILSLLSSFIGLRKILKFLIPVFSGVSKGVGAVVTGTTKLSFIFKGLAILAGKILTPFMLLVGVFQTISRAIGFARIADLQMLPAMMASFAEISARAIKALSVIIAPLMEVIDTVAMFISTIFQVNTWMRPVLAIFDKFVIILEALAKVTMLARAGLEGLFFALFQLVQNIMAGKFMSLGEGVGDAFNAGVDSILEKYMAKMQGDDAAISQSIVNINGDIKVQQQFKENADPDRIAFSFTEQLLKIARNPVQAAGGGMTRGGQN